MISQYTTTTTMPKNKTASAKKVMNPNNHVISVTQEGLDELKAELKQLIEVKLPAVIERVAVARAHGDLSENAEYHSAQDDKKLIETRIEEIEATILKAKVVKKSRSHSSVGMGNVVVIKKKGTNKPMTITIVGDFEADPINGKISSASPLGEALMGSKKGDKVLVKAPAGEIEYEVVEIK